MRLLRALLFTAFITVVPLTAAAQTGLPCSNPHLASDAEANSVEDGSIIAGKTYLCPDDARLGVSNAVGNAKTALAGMRCGTSVNIEQLDPKFAICASKFMQALRAQSPSACIESAFRDPNQQAAACRGICGALSCPGKCAAPGKSYHQKGLAIDIGKLNMSLNQFWQLAGQAGLGNPTGLHRTDPNHIQVMNGGSNCSDVGYQPVSDDSFISGPAMQNPYFNYAPSPMPSMMTQPFTPIATGFSAGIATPQTTPTTPSALTNPALSTSPTQNSCTPSFSCSKNVQYYQTSSCTTQVYQVCSNGCNGNVCAAASSTGNYINNSFGTSSTSTTDTNTNTNTNVNSDGNVSDILNSIATNFTAVDVATSSGVAFALNPNTGEVAQIPTESNDTGTIASSGIGVISSAQPTNGGQQTFTSGDLTDGATLGGTQNKNGLAAVLASMRSALEWAIRVLTPFGGAPRTTY